MSKSKANDKNNGNSGNTNGGTETSFTKTPQAKDDALGTLQSGQLDYTSTTYMLNVMHNDLAGKAKSLWSVDDGINDSGAMDGYEAGDLLTQDEAGITGLAENQSQFGAALMVTADGHVAYDAGTISGQIADDLTGLALGETLVDSFIYAIRMANGTLSWAQASVTLTGVNDEPVVTAVSLAAIEDNGTVTGSFAGDDVDSDDDIDSLTYNIIGAPDTGTLVNNGNGTFTFDPGSEFQALAKDEEATFNLSYTATDRHGAVSDPASLTITVTGTNDDPTLAAGAGAASEDGASIAVDLAALGADVDSDDDGSTLTYTINSAPAEGSASISGTDLNFAVGSDFQNLAVGETRQVVVGITATDAHGASATNDVTITVTGTNDAPTLAAGIGAATEDGPAVTVNLAPLGADVDSDDDGATLTYSINSAPAEGSASISGTDLNFAVGSDFQDLAVGETRQVVVGITATDAHGASATNNVTVTVTGTNDAPEITGGVASASITMDPAQAPFTVEQWTGYQSDQLANLKAHAANNAPNYTVSANVIDFTDDPSGFAGELPGSSPWPAAQATGTTGTGGINNTFFARITSNIVITQADTYTFRTFNDDGVFLSVNNQSLISNSGYFGETSFEGSIYLEPGVYPLELYFYEGGGEASLELSYKNSSGIYQLVGNTPVTANGTLTFDDVDLSDAHTVTTSVAGASAVGTLTASIAADTTGNGTGGQIDWTYAVSDTENQQFQSLAAGETSVQEFTVTVDDGKGGTDSQTVSITVTGVNDAAVLGTAVADLTETDAQLTTSGTLSISDIDNGEALFNAQSGTAGTYGSFSIDANGNWSFASDGALDELAEGEVVTDIFNVTSVDGTATTVTVNITGTADGPTATADNNSLTASRVNNDSDNTVYWVDWTSATVVSQVGGRNPTYTVQGTITLSDRTIDVTYHGQAAEAWGAVPGVQLNGGTDFFVTGRNPNITNTEGVGVYTGPAVGNGPTNNDIIRLHHADSPRTLTFSEPVENLFFAIVSMNNNGYLFDQDFDVVASADSVTDSGYFGWSEAWAKTNPEPGRYGITTDPAITGVGGMTEFHGVLAINNALESLTWESQADENWNAFTIGTYGVAQSATVSGNVLDNDDLGNAPSVEVSDVNGSAMVGNSVTLTLASGAILKVDRDGEYLYDDNGQFTSLAAGQTQTDSVVYTITDSNGYSDSATLDIVVTGINDGPEAVADSASVDEDASVTINVLANDTDPDNGDTLSIQSAANGQHGSVAIVGGQLVYTPDSNFNGTDSFTYTARDAAGLTSTATVDVTVNPVNDAPTITSSNTLVINNGSFENGLTGWTQLDGGVDVVGDWQTGFGSNVVDLNALSQGGVTQTLATTIGETYTIGFQMSKNPGRTSSASMEVSAGNNSQTFTYGSSNSQTDMQWQSHTFTFTATSTSTDLSFVSLVTGADARGPAIDGVSANATLEDTATTITGLSVADIDAGSATLRLDLTTGDGSLALVNAAGLVAVDSDGSDGTLSYTGSTLALNAALANGVSYDPTTDFNGTASVNATINDLGATGGGSLSASQAVAIEVYATPGPVVSALSTTVSESKIDGEINSILFVDDSNTSRSWESTWFSALSNNGYDYDQTTLPVNGNPSQNLADYDLVIWSVSDRAYTNLTSQNVSTLTSYLQQGGKLLYAGGHSVYSEPFISSFASQYLGISSYQSNMPTINSGQNTATGPDGSYTLAPITGGVYNGTMMSAFNASGQFASSLMKVNNWNSNNDIAAINDPGTFVTSTWGFDIAQLSAQYRDSFLGYTLDEMGGKQFSFNLLSGASDPNGGTLSVSDLVQVNGPAVTANVDSNGFLSFEEGSLDFLDDGETVDLVYQYDVDSASASSSNTVTITVVGVADNG